MEAILIILGVVCLSVGVFAGLLALGVFVAMWRAWWMHPLWALAIVPLGVPQIGYWHFVALSMFITGFSAHRAQIEPKDEPKADKAGRLVGNMLMLFVWPVATFYFVRWYLS